MGVSAESGMLIGGGVDKPYNPSPHPVSDSAGLIIRMARTGTGNGGSGASPGFSPLGRHMRANGNLVHCPGSSCLG